MKFFVLATAMLAGSIIMLSCTSQTTTPPPGNNPAAFPFTLSANVDGTDFTAGASMTITDYPTASLYMVDLTSTASGNRTMDLSIFLPKDATFPKTVNVSKFTGNYSESGSSWVTNQDSLGSATITISSFSFSAADTTIAATFSYKAWGGASGSAVSVKNVTAGTVVTHQ
jgi:hypothetical protein